MNNSTRVSARDVMRDNFVEIDGLTTVQDALKLMLESDAKTIIIKKCPVVFVVKVINPGGVTQTLSWIL